MSTEIRRLLETVELVANSLGDVAKIGWAPSVDAKRWARDNEAALREALALLASQRPPTEDVCPAHDTQGYGCELPRGHREPHERLRGLSAFKQWEEYEPPAPAVPSPADPQPDLLKLIERIVTGDGAQLENLDLPRGHREPHERLRGLSAFKQWEEYEPPAPAVPSPADSQPDLLKLIERIVTGDGAQLENLDLSDAEWDALCEDVGNDPEHFEVTMRLEDWKALARVARASPAGHPSTEAQKDEGYQEALHRPVKGKP